MKLVITIVLFCSINIGVYAKSDLSNFIEEIPDDEIETVLADNFKKQVIQIGDSSIPTLLHHSLNEDYGPDKQEVILNALEALIQPKCNDAIG